MKSLKRITVAAIQANILRRRNRSRFRKRTGKICFIASQVVGKNGRVIGVDMTDDMLEVARRNAPIVAERVGFSNVEFKKGRIQDLGLDIETLDDKMNKLDLGGADAYLKANEIAKTIREEDPMIPNESVDVVVSNCVLNLVDNSAKKSCLKKYIES